MKEVIFTFEDLDINIYYQGIDNIHNQKEQLNILSNEYKQCYCCEFVSKEVL